MGWRKIEVNGKQYRWKCGSLYVTIQDENGQRVGPAQLTGAAVKGLSMYAWERGGWKKTSDASVFPAEVKAYIEDNT